MTDVAAKCYVSIAVLKQRQSPPDYVLGVAATAAFLGRLVNTHLARVTEGKIPGLSQENCRDKQLLLATVLGSEGKDTTLAMEHGDFKLYNVIVDRRYNIKGS